MRADEREAIARVEALCRRAEVWGAGSFVISTKLVRDLLILSRVSTPSVVGGEGGSAVAESTGAGPYGPGASDSSAEVGHGCYCGGYWLDGEDPSHRHDCPEALSVRAADVVEREGTSRTQSGGSRAAPVKSENPCQSEEG